MYIVVNIKYLQTESILSIQYNENVLQYAGHFVIVAQFLNVHEHRLEFFVYLIPLFFCEMAFF